ncbi:MAG: hypothetical protein HY537_14290 [Deltaproteobacteria bacterium]|nr:hypothetical protein [Deltaproteobacteria bacterium]
MGQAERLVLTAQCDDSSPEIQFPVCWGEVRRLMERDDGSRYYGTATAWCAPQINGTCPQDAKTCATDNSPIVLSRFKGKPVTPTREAKPKSCWGNWIVEKKMPDYSSFDIKCGENDRSSVPVKFALGAAMCEFDNNDEPQEHTVACMTAAKVTAEQCRIKNFKPFNVQRLKEAYAMDGGSLRYRSGSSGHTDRSPNSSDE